MAYENFMCNKDFHPGNIRNLRKMYEAEQRLKQEEKRQEELRQQYLKEQEIYKSKELMGKANPMNFMYEPPPGFQKDKEKTQNGDSEPPLKFDWQKTGRAAPREDYAKDMPLRDQPFGIEVRNVKCIKCGKWGHINTDRECPLYGKAKPEPADGSEPLPPPLPNLDLVEDGMIFKQCVKDRIVDSKASNQQILASDEEQDGDDYGELLAGFSKKERKKILRKLSKMDDDGGQKKKKKKRKESKKHHHSSKKRRTEKRRERSPSTDSESSSESEDDTSHRHKPSKKTRHRHSSEDEEETVPKHSSSRHSSSGHSNSKHYTSRHSSSSSKHRDRR